MHQSSYMAKFVILFNIEQWAIYFTLFSPFGHFVLPLIKENVKMFECQVIFTQESNCEKDMNTWTHLEPKWCQGQFCTKSLKSFALKCEWHFAVTLILGLQPRQGLAKAWAMSEAQESHFMLPKV
jgi:hypothetical protein